MCRCFSNCEIYKAVNTRGLTAAPAGLLSEHALGEKDVSFQMHSIHFALLAASVGMTRERTTLSVRKYAVRRPARVTHRDLTFQLQPGQLQTSNLLDYIQKLLHHVII